MILANILTLLALIGYAYQVRQLSRRLKELRRQRETAYDLLRQGENYTRHLEGDLFEVRKIIGAKNGERTVAAARRVIKEGREVWS